MKNADILGFVKKHGGTMLTIGSCIGAVSTAYLAYKAGCELSNEIVEDSDEKGLNEAKTRVILPVMVSLGLTCGCAVGADILNKKQKDDLMALIMAGGSAFSAYRQEVRNRYGEEVDADICDCVSKHADAMCMRPDIPDRLVTWKINFGVPELPVCRFEAYERDVINAEKHFNRNYILGMAESTHNLLDFYGVDNVPEAFWDYGWAIDDSEIYFIDLVHKRISDNLYEIWPVFAPWYQFEELDMFGEPY